LAAVIAAAAYPNAASFKWAASGMTAMDGTTALSGTATLYAYLSTADAATAKAVDTQTMTAGVISNTDAVFEDDSLVGGSTYKFYYTIEDSKGNSYVSATKATRAQATATVSLTFAATGGTWTAAPEPTSGLLLLLGMAGLALKRKRA
jgi:hypothetical protein